jgi:hypothetical protein
MVLLWGFPGDFKSTVSAPDRGLSEKKQKTIMLRTSLMKTGLPVVMLVLFSFILGGCASQQGRHLKKQQQDVLKSYQQQVVNTIDDPERARELIRIGENLYLQIRNDTKILLKMTEELKDLNGAYDTTREELETAFHALNTHRRNMRNKILAARNEALPLTTPEEWQALMSRRGTLLEFIQQNPGIL